MGSEDLDRAFRLLLTTESEIGHVPYPKLVLEMALIKLATLTPVVPVDELLERIDELQQRLAAAPAAPAAAAQAGAAQRSWEEFLAFVGKEKVTLLPYLQSSQPPPLGGPTLALNVPGGYYYDYLAQRNHTQLVEDLARRFFGRPLRITVSAAAPAQEQSSTPAESPAVMQAAALDDPVVRAAVEILGGEVQEVKSRARRGKGTE
jgi:DNA polymerase-3 subunit gamma/tau